MGLAGYVGIKLTPISVTAPVIILTLAIADAIDMVADLGYESLHAALLNGEALEFLAFEIRESLQHLGQISGETTTDSVLGGIFSQFCIGK